MDRHSDKSLFNFPHKSIVYRLSQLMGFLLGTRFFVTVLLTFALYVSTFFLFNQEESLRNFVFDFKIHGIIFCTILSILAGGIINQFYDKEKDKIAKPFRFQIQSFLKQNYFLYAYLGLNLLSLTVAFLISERVFVFFLVYQFVMWFYSHKLSKWLFVNNLTFVFLTLYPFFGMLVYYQTFSEKLFLMALFLFFVLLSIDLVKDTLTKRVDRTFGYTTIPNYFSPKISTAFIVSIMTITFLISMMLIEKIGISRVLAYYFVAGLFIFVIAVSLILQEKKRYNFVTLNLLRFWVFIGIIAMLLDGILTKF